MTADASTHGAQSERSDAAYAATWGWRPPLPPEEVPVFVWPPRPRGSSVMFDCLADDDSTPAGSRDLHERGIPQ